MPKTTIAPTTETAMLPRSIPVAPGRAKTRFQIQPPTTAPTIPSNIVPIQPPGSLRLPGMIILARTPAIKPTTIHAIIDIVWFPFHLPFPFSRARLLCAPPALSSYKGGRFPDFFTPASRYPVNYVSVAASNIDYLHSVSHWANRILISIRSAKGVLPEKETL